MSLRALLVAALLLTGCVHQRFTFSPEAIRGQMRMPRSMGHVSLFATLESGLRVVAYSFEGEQDVELILSFQGGTSAEPLGKEGLASLSAYLADQATPGRGGVRIDERLYAAGVVGRWSWSQDELVLRATAKRAKLREVIQVEGWRLQDPAAGITEPQVMRMREYLAAELERAKPGFAEQAWLVEGRALDGTPYGRRPPTPEGMRKLTLQDVRDYLQKVIRPERAILTVASGEPAEGTMNTAMEITARRPKGAVTASAEIAVFDPPAVAGPTERIVMKADKRRLWLAWAVPGSRSMGEPLLRIASNYLRAAAVDRLKEQGLLDQVGEITAMAHWKESAGVILLSLVLKPGSDAERIRPVVERSTELAQDRIKKGMASRRVADITREQLELERYVDNEGRAPIGEVARALRTAGESTPTPGFQRAMNGLQDGSAPTRMAAFLAMGPSAAVLIEPSDKGPEAPPDQMATSKSDLEWGEYAPFDRGAAPGAEAVRALLTPPGLDKARRRTLANGLEVVVLVRKGTPFAKSVLDFRGTSGYSETQRARIYLAGATAVLPRGCGVITTSAGVDGARLRIGTTTEGLRFGLESLACWLTVSEAGTKAREVTPLLKARYELAEKSFLAGPPPAIDDQPRWGDSWARRTMRPASATLVVAGDLDPEVVFTMAAEVFGTWVAGPGTGLPALPPAPWPAPAERTTVIYDQGGDTEGWATLLLRTSGESPGTLAEQETLAKLLESRLERALVLGEFKVNVDRVSVPGLHLLGVRIKGRSDRLAPALKRVLDELGSLKATIDDPLAISTARWNVARDWAFAFNRISQTAARYAELASAGLPSDGYERFGEQVAGVTPERLREVMSRYSIGKEGIRIGGPFDRLAPQLRELGLDPIRVPEEKEKPKD